MTQGEDRVCRKIYTFLVIFSHFRSSSIRKSAFVNFFGSVQIISRLNSSSIRESAFVNFFGSVQIISRLNSQSKFQLFTLFTGRHVGGLTWLLYTRLCNFVKNISTNISTLGQHTLLKLGELSSLIIVYNITIFFYLIRCMVFYFIFYCVTMHTLHLIII